MELTELAATMPFAVARDGELRGISRPRHVGRTTIVVQTELRDANDKLVALVTQTQAVLSS
jgi:1,4-dihydroxy-2-naphthoyl-CoA hydrolase